MVGYVSSSTKRRPVVKRTQHGLEELTQNVLGVLQTRGRLTFDELALETHADHRRLYDIVNVLSCTQLLSKSRRTDKGAMLTYGDGVPLSHPVCLPTLLADIETEIRVLSIQTARLKALSKLSENPVPPSPGTVRKVLREAEASVKL